MPKCVVVLLAGCTRGRTPAGACVMIIIGALHAGLSIVGPRFETMTLSKIRKAVYNPQANTVATSIFKHEHFFLNALLKMRFYLAAQCFGQRAMTLMQQSCHRGLGGTKRLAAHVDAIVDIANCSRSKSPDTHGVKIQAVADPNDPQLGKLVSALQHMSKWRESTKGLPTDHQAGAFLPQETWLEFQGICLGLPVLAHLHCKPGSGRKLVFRRISSDYDEHHFRC